MNNDLFDWDLKVREPENRQSEESLTVKRRTPPSRIHKSGSRRRLNILPLAAAVIILTAATTFLSFALRRDAEPESAPALPAEDESVTFFFGGMVLTAIDGLPLNPYDKTAFDLDENGRVVYTLNGRRAKTGIDVSTHQKDVDWQAVAADGIDFAILRLGYRGYTEGKLFVDQTFEQNLQGALDAGLEVGVYFFSQALTREEAEEEADYVLSVLDGRELAFPVAFDWEPVFNEDSRTGSLNDAPDGDAITRCAAAFCKRIEEAGYRPAVYFNQTQGYLSYDLRELDDCCWWLAEYDVAPDFYYHFDMWQYSETGQIDGIQGNVDMNLAFWPDADISAGSA